VTALARRAGAGLSALLLTAGVLLAGVAPAAAAPQPVGHCTARSGALVAVDFAPWGGPLLRACGSTPATGYALLNQGGWHTAGDDHDGPGFICRIGYAGYHRGAPYPGAAQQACVQTPPASAYWAFWQAAPGQDTWTYSQAGAMSYHAAPGSVELWSFGGTNLSGTSGSAIPSVSPDRLRDLAVTRAGRTAIVDAAPARRAVAPSSGPAAPTFIALGLAVVLGAASIAISRRRNRSRP
jgi:hypothetical protein